MTHLIKYLLIFLALFSVSTAKISSAPFFDTSSESIQEVFEVPLDLMKPRSVLDQNIPQYTKTSEATLSFCGSRHRQTGSLKQELLSTLKNAFKLDAFVETGTYRGDTAEIARGVFPEVHTIELSVHLFTQACQRFQNSRDIFVHNGDAPIVLKEILPGISGRILFYLDGHYSGGETALSAVNTPILEELRVIRDTHKDQSVILIDDIRLFQNSLYPEKIKNTCMEEYPDLRSIVEALLAINPTYQVCFLGDALLAYPQDASISVTPLVRACAIHRLSASFPEFPKSAIEISNDIIGKASWHERNELVIYYDTFSDFELTFGFRSFSSLWYGLLLLKDGDAETAMDLLKHAANHSPPGWCIDVAIQRVKKQLGISDEVPPHFLATTLALNQKSFPFIANELSETEYSSKMAVISISKIKNPDYRLQQIGNGCDYLAIPEEYHGTSN